MLQKGRREGTYIYYTNESMQAKYGRFENKSPRKKKKEKAFI
jgi:hypothetical protein